MSKISDAYVVNGVIYNAVMDIIYRNTLNQADSCLIICADDEVFEQAMNTVTNKYPHAIGVNFKADSGMVQQVYKSDIYIEHAGIFPKEDSPAVSVPIEGDPFPRVAAPRYRNRFVVMTKKVFDEAAPEDFDLTDWDELGVKHFIASTGGAY